MPGPIIHPTRIDPGDGRNVTGTLTITCYSDGALSVAGPIADVPWCLAVLDNARDAVKGHNSGRSELCVPGKDVSLA